MVVQGIAEIFLLEKRKRERLVSRILRNLGSVMLNFVFERFPHDSDSLLRLHPLTPQRVTLGNFEKFWSNVPP